MNSNQPQTALSTLSTRSTLSSLSSLFSRANSVIPFKKSKGKKAVTLKELACMNIAIPVSAHIEFEELLQCVWDMAVFAHHSHGLCYYEGDKQDTDEAFQKCENYRLETMTDFDPVEATQFVADWEDVISLITEIVRELP